MVFWSIVLGVVAVVLLVAWRFDRRHRGQVRGDIWKRSDINTSQNLIKGQSAEKGASSGLNHLPFGH